MTTSASRTHQQFLATVYDESAEAYEQHWAPVLHRHARDLVALVPPPPPDRPRRVLDVATGAGTLVPVLRELAGDGGHVFGVDRSLGMLCRPGHIAPRVQGDALTLPLRDGCADVAVLAFVLFMLPDVERAAAEAARVLRPGGWLLAATWGEQTGTSADEIVREEYDAAGAPELPELHRSDELTDTPARMAALLGSAGFADVRTLSRPLDARFDAASALALRTGCGSLGWRFGRLDPDRQAAVRARIAARLSVLPPEAYVDRSEVLLTTARRARPARGAGGP